MQLLLGWDSYISAFSLSLKRGEIDLMKTLPNYLPLRDCTVEDKTFTKGLLEMGLVWFLEAYCSPS